MANGPFSPVQLGAIETPRLTPEDLPKSSIEAGAGVFQAGAQAVGAAAEAIRKAREQSLEEEVTDNVDALQTALTAVSDPQINEQVFEGAARGNPFFRKAKEELIRLQDAVQSGKTPTRFATLRAETIIKESVRNAPEFADEIRQTAQSALGFNAETQAFRQALGLADEALTAEEALTPEEIGIQKTRQEVGRLMGLGFDRATAVDMLRTEQQAGFAKEQVGLKAAVGTLEFGDMEQASQAALASFNSNQLQVLAAQSAQGGVPNPTEAAAAYRRGAEGMIAQLQREAAAANIPPDQVQEQVAILRSNSAQIAKLIEDGSALNVLTDKTNLGAKKAMENIMLNDPSMFNALSVFGGDGTVAYITALSKYSTPQQRQILGQISGSFAGQQAILDAAKGHAQGAEPNTPQQKQTYVGLSALLLQDSNAGDDAHQNALTRLEQDASLEQRIDALKDPSVLKSIKLGSRETQLQVSNLLSAIQDSALSEAASAIKEIPRAAFEVDRKSGEITITDPAQLEPGAAGVGPEAAALRERFGAVRKPINVYNKMVRTLRPYMEAGIVEKQSVGGFVDQILGTGDQAPNVSPTTDNGVVRWERGPDGTPRRVQ